jgi:hypothetical protein
MTRWPNSAEGSAERVIRQMNVRPDAGRYGDSSGLPGRFVRYLFELPPPDEPPLPEPEELDEPVEAADEVAAGAGVELPEEDFSPDEDFSEEPPEAPDEPPPGGVEELLADRLSVR